MNARLLTALLLGSLGAIACRDTMEPVAIAPTHQVTFAPPGTAWATVAGMGATRHMHGSATGADGRIYVFGGMDLSGWVPGNEAYSPQSDSWSPVASQGPWCCGGVARGGDDRFYLVGGENDTDGATTAARAYDPVANTWSALPPLSITRDLLAVASDADGRVYAIGGAEWGDSRRLLNSVERYDPTTGTWADVSPMGARRWYHAAALGPDGRIYVFGGLAGFTPIADAEVYDPASDTWSPIAPLPATRYAHAAVTGGDGLIYLVGGVVDNGSSGRTVIAYDPANDSWSDVPEMTFGRTQLGASLGPEGRIYATGGSAPYDVPTETAESFATRELAPENQSPVALAGQDQTLRCEAGGAEGWLNGSGSSDPDGDPLSYRWLEGDRLIADRATTAALFGIGTHSVTLRVTDDQNASAEDGLLVTVIDDRAPDIHMHRTNPVLWSDRRFHLVTRVKAVDTCQDATVSVTVSSIPSSKYYDDERDWKVIPNQSGGFDVYVRADIYYGRPSRIFAIRADAKDGSGNKATMTTYVLILKQWWNNRYLQ